MGYWRQSTDEALHPSPKVQPGVFSGQRQGWKTPGERGVSKSVECDTLSLQCSDMVGRQEQHTACKNVGCWFVGSDDLTGAFHIL